MTDPLRIAFLLFPDVTQLDLTGPAQVLSRLGNARLDLVWKTLDPVPTDAGFAILPTATFADVPRADILCVPGGFGVNGVIADDEAMAWIQRIAADARWVTSVCTGSLILGAAGLLDGYRAGCHWAQRDMLPLFGAIPVAERVVVDRNRVTGGGVTAGIDFALALTAMIRGEAHARAVQLSLEYDPAPPFDSGSPARAGAALVETYAQRVRSLAPTRDDDLRTLAKGARLRLRAALQPADAVPDIEGDERDEDQADDEIGAVERGLDARIAVPSVAELHPHPGEPESTRATNRRRCRHGTAAAASARHPPGRR